jgi:hypothetical protein
MRAEIDLTKIGLEQLGLTIAQCNTLQEKLKHCYNEQKGHLLE